MRVKLTVGVLFLSCTLAILLSTATGVTDRSELGEGSTSTTTLSSKQPAKDEFTHTVFLEEGTATW
jgi:hypothetical protein